MSRKYNTKHDERGTSRYKERLSARGQTPVAVRMEDLDTLRKRQLKREYDTGSPLLPNPFERAAMEDEAALCTRLNHATDVTSTTVHVTARGK